MTTVATLTMRSSGRTDYMKIWRVQSDSTQKETNTHTEKDRQTERERESENQR